jgi:hypothetical protein
MTIKSAWARVDFALGTAEVQESNAVRLPITAVPANVQLTPAAAPHNTGTDLFLLNIEFFQTVNGIQYPLNNGAFNVVGIIEVA